MPYAHRLTNAKSDGAVQHILFEFDRWRQHYDTLLSCWLENHNSRPYYHPPQNKSLLAQQLAGSVRAVFSRRLGPVTEAHFLRELATSCSASYHEGKGSAENYVRAGLDLAAFLAAHNQLVSEG